MTAIFEYQMVKLEIDDGIVMMSSHNDEARKELDNAIIVLLNKEGKKGWLLTAAGLNHIPSIPLYREKPKRTIRTKKKTLQRK